MFARGSGPIFVRSLDCQDDSVDVFRDCVVENDLGVFECARDHSDDAGVHCEAYCDEETTLSLSGNYMWPTTSAEETRYMNCMYGGIGVTECQIVEASAFRYCNEYGVWNDSDTTNCYTQVTQMLCDIRNVELSPDNVESSLMDLQMAVSQANETEDQSSINLATITNIFKTAAENTSITVSTSVLESATHIVAEIQNWNTDNVTLAVLQNQSAEIVFYYEEMAVRLAEEQGFSERLLIETDDLVFLGETLNGTSLKSEGVKFTVVTSDSGALSGNSISANTTSQSQDEVSITLPPAVFQQFNDTSFSLLFSMYNSSVLLPQANETRSTFGVASTVLGATVVGHEVVDVEDNITIVLRLEHELSRVPNCVVWNSTISDWDESGCVTNRTSREYVSCYCHHLSLFGVLVNTDPAVCTPGFRPNEDVTTCIAIPPPLAVSVPNNSNPNTFDVTITSETTMYSVELGAEFAVQCTSEPSEENQFVGMVTWYMTTIVSGQEKQVPVPVIDVTSIPFDMGSASGANAEQGLPSARTTDFVDIDETLGQLYAYRYSNTLVVLGTRSAEDEDVQTAVGISDVASGTYRCIAENSNATTESSVVIQAETGGLPSNPTYIRFSTIPVESISTRLEFPLVEFVFAMFSTMILEDLNSEDASQKVINCSSREHAGQMDSERIECRAVRISENRRVPTEMLERAFNTITEQLPDLIMPDSSVVSEDGFCNFEVQVTAHGTYNWSETLVGQTDEQTCVFGRKETSQSDKATRYCMSHDMWDGYDGDACISEVTYRISLIAEEGVTADTAVAVVSDLTSAVGEGSAEDQNTENLEVINTVLNDVTELIGTGNFTANEDLVEDSVGILDTLSTWPPEVLEEASSDIVQSVESITENLVSQENFNETLDIVTEVIKVRAERPTTSMINMTGIQFSPNDIVIEQGSGSAIFLTPEPDNDISLVNNNISVPGNAFENITTERVGAVFSFYNSSVLFPLRLNQTEDRENNSYKVIGSPVISATVAGQLIVNLKDPVNISLEITEVNASNPVCVSWNFSADGGRGNWTTLGCEIMSQDEDTKVVICKCTHLTNFGVLVDVNARVSQPEDDKALRAFSIAGSILSMVGLLLTIITMLAFKKIRKRDASKFHVQLCIAMFFMLLVFLVGIDRTENEIGCTFCSLLIQYFSMASVAWMGGEALLMFQKLIIVFGHITTKHIIIISIVAWSVPAPFLVAALGTLGTGQNYLISENNFCFISHIGVFFGVFLGPILALVLFNTVVFVLVIRVLIKHSVRKLKDTTDKKKVMGTIKTLISIVSIMLMFGLQWLFGALTIAQASLAFQWLFVIFSSLQGFFLFLFFCVIGKDARQEWLNVFSCGRRNKKKRGVITSTAPSGGRTGKRTGSTYFTSYSRSRTMLRSAGMLPQSETSTSVELASTGPVTSEPATNGTHPHLQSVAEETEFIIPNGNADMTDGDRAKLLEAQPEIDCQVPPYILENRFIHHYVPSSRASQVMPDEDESCDSTEYFGEVTQITDLSIISNDHFDSTSDISDGELTHL